MKALYTTLRSAVIFPFNALATPIDLVFCIPGIGRIVKWVWNVIVTLLHLPFGLIEWAFLTKGYKPEKKLKIGIVLFSKEPNNPVVETQKVVAQLKKTSALFREKANIRILSAKSSASEEPAEDWITIYKKPPSKKVLNVGCNKYAFRQDLWVTGMMFQFMALTRLFYTNFQRIIGYGSPIVIFIVEDVDGFRGCSLGPLTDYVTVDRKGLVCMTHELAHACNLFHYNDDEENLMHPKGCEKTTLTTKQIALLRASRHVTFI
jgi:hypothetical protein